MRNRLLKQILAIVIAIFIIMPNITVMQTVNAADMDPEYETPKHGIPVLYINIDESLGTIEDMNNSEDHSAECYGTVDIKSPAGYKSEYTDKEAADMTGLELEYIRGRGNSSWTMNEKKPYKLKFKKGVDFFGMGKNKHWVLLSDAMDSTHLKNRISYWLADQMGMEYTSKLVPVEVVMNGEYNGLYYLCEQVRVGESRVDIDELTEEDNDPSVITGGYFLAMTYDCYFHETVGDFQTIRDVGFFYDEPDFSEYQNDNQKKYITNYLQKTENAIFGSDYKDCDGVSYKDYLDVTSAANYYLFQQFSSNHDAYTTTSNYVYKKRGGKLYFGPIWDCDGNIWGREDINYYDANNTSQTNYHRWLEWMKNDPEFKSLLNERWAVMNEKVSELTKEGGQFDKYYNEIKTAQKYDELKWGRNIFAHGSFEEDCNHLKTWIEKRQIAFNSYTDRMFESMVDGSNLWVNGKWYGNLGMNSYGETASWKSDDKGWWYEDTSGWYAKDQWMNIDYTWYYFDSEGYAATNEWRDGCRLLKDGSYGYNYTGSWKRDDGGYTFCDTSGWTAKCEWQKIDGKWYYFTDKGYMDYGEYRDGCWLGDDGAMVDGYTGGTWHSDANGWWYSDGEWYPANQYLWIDGVQYYFGADGYLQ